MSDKERKVSAEDLNKALEAVRELSKGRGSGGTATTEVPAMQDASVGAGSGAGATQVYHTPSNSDPKGWAGSTAYDCPDDGAADNVADNGTDYVAQSAAFMKSILGKIAKGQPLTSEEQAFMKGMAYSNDAKKDDEEEVSKAGYGKDEDDDDKDDDKDVKKSLEDYAQENDTVSEGLEVSDFLREFVGTFNKSLSDLETRLSKSIHKTAQKADTSDTEEFHKSLAEAFTDLSAAIVAQGQRIEQLEATPARAPKSATNVQALSKGLGNEQNNGFEELTKSQACDVLVDMVEKGLAMPQDVVRVESTGEISDALRRKINDFRQNK